MFARSILISVLPFNLLCNMFGLSLSSFVLQRIMLSYLYLSTYTGFQKCWFQYHTMFVSFNSNTQGITSGAGIAYPSTLPVFIAFFVGSLIISFLCIALQIIVCPFVIFLFSNVVSFDLRRLNTPFVSSQKNQKPQREEGQTTQWPNEKGKQRSKASHKIAKIVQHEGH